MQLYDSTTIVSACEKEYLQKNNPLTQIDVIPIAVENKYFEAQNQNKKNVLLFSGNLQMAGIADGLFDFLENGYQKVATQVPDLQFIVKIQCATKEQREEIKKYHKTILVDYVEDYADFLKEPKIMIAPDKSGTGLKNRVLQAFAAAIPVVGSYFALEGFKYENGVHAFRADTVSEMAERIVELFNDESLYAVMSKAAAKLAEENYGENVIGQRWRDFIINLKQ